MPVDPSDIETIEDARLWAVDHDSKIDAFWDHQRISNDRNTEEHKEIFIRLNSIEKKIVWLVTVATFGGTLGGTAVGLIVTKFIGGLSSG